MDPEIAAPTPPEDELHLELTDVELSLRAANPEAKLKVRVEVQSGENILPEEKTYIFSRGSWREELPLRPRLDAAWQKFRIWLTWEKAFFALSILVYLLTRLIRIVDFPIYFFSDEAVQTLLASDLVRDGFKGYDDVFLPTYFSNYGKYSLGTTVYLQLFPYLLFGRSIWVTRVTAALATLLAAVSLHLILKKVFHSKAPWLGILVLTATPTWFLHSRTAFETCLAASFYAAFLYCYMRYRKDSPRHLYAAVVLAALAFYSYNPTRIVVAVTAIFLLFNDLRYHWQQRKTVLIALGVTAICALPYVRFTLAHEGEGLKHLEMIGSYWFQPISLGEKLANFAKEYLKGINPLYWYFPSDKDLNRHVMKGYGHLLFASLPLMLVGLGITLRNFKSSAHRLLLIAVLAAPSGAALVGLGITRSMTIVIPHVLLCAIALSAGLDWLAKRKAPRIALNLFVFTILSVFSFWMMKDAIVNGPLWYEDYSLTGMQYGARQLFAAVQETLDDNPDISISVSPSWANASDLIARFTLGDPLPVTMESIYTYIDEPNELSPEHLFVMIPEEYNTALESEKFTDIEVLHTLPYPNGEPGFYFVRLRYVDDIERVFTEEQKALYELGEAVEINWLGQTLEAQFQSLDMGEVSQLFDKDPGTFVRSAAANPFLLQFAFAEPVTINTVDVHIGGAPTNMIIQAYDANGELLEEISESYPGVPDPREISLSFSAPLQAAALHFSIENEDEAEPSHVHVWEIRLD
jgi:4-amino-4-deoxy-L-arabinose transferase-like glycosyltransferase